MAIFFIWVGRRREHVGGRALTEHCLERFVTRNIGSVVAANRRRARYVCRVSAVLGREQRQGKGAVVFALGAQLVEYEARHPVDAQSSQHIVLDVVEEVVRERLVGHVALADLGVHALGKREDVLLVDVAEESIAYGDVHYLVVLLHRVAIELAVEPELEQPVAVGLLQKVLELAHTVELSVVV